MFFREAARHGERGKTAEIADAAKRILKRKLRFQIHFQRSRTDRLRRGG